MINIVTCVWNSEKYINLCIDSVLSQKNQNYRMFIIDDVSDDNTCSIIEDKTKNYPNIKFIKNETKKYKLKNFDEILSNNNLIKDEDIILELDGDDWLAHNNVIDIIYDTYKTNNILISNSKFVYSNGKIGFSDKCNISLIRKSPFIFSHLRTWKTKLWRNINKKYFIDPRSNDYFKITADMAYSLPMLELATQDKYVHIPEILLVYNDQNPHNDHKPGSAAGGQLEQGIVEKIIRNTLL